MITRQQYNRLKEIKETVDRLQKESDDLFDEAEEITKEHGHTFDYVFNGFWDIDKFLERIEIEVEA